MAVWRFACKTILGMNLDLKIVGRNDLPLRLTRAVSGSGSTNPTKLMGLTDVIEPVQDLQLLDTIEHIDESTVMIPVILRNSDVKKKYDMYQIGIYAEDPDLGEILYIVLQSEGVEEIPAATEMKDFKLEWYINLSVSNADNIEVVINETGVLTVEQGDARYVIKSVYEIDKNQLADGIYKNQKVIADHLADKENPHETGKDQVGLDKVDNTADADKPVSGPQQAAIDAAKKLLSDIINNHLADTNNPHKVSRMQMKVDKVDNTPDMEKPVSEPQQTALNALYQQLTGYVEQKIAGLINGAPAALDTLKEVADAIASHKSIMDALDAAIGKKANEAEFDSHVKDTTAHVTAAERTKWNDTNTKKHTHDNKSVLDGITSTLISGWNSAVEHISDAVKHITSTERDKWNNGSHNYGTCSTAAATAAKVVACTGFKLAAGAEIAVKFTVTNTAASPTLNVNSTGAKAIYYRGAAISAGYLGANRTYVFRYNGTQWDLVGDINTDTNTTYSDMKGATADAAGTHGLAPAPGAGAQGKYLRGDGTWQTPANTNNAVTQTNTPSTNASYRILMSATADDTTRTEGARKDADLTYNPSKNTLATGKVNADTADSTVAFSTGDAINPTGWADIAAIASGEKHSSLMRKLSLAVKNVRYLWKLLGSTSLAGIGDGTVTGAINALNTGMEKLGIIKPTATGTINDVHPGTTNEPTSICSIWIPVGLYIVIGTAKFTLPKQSQIEIHIGSTDNKYSIGSTLLTLPAGIQWAKNIGVIKIEEISKQVVLRVRQDSGSIISCTANLEAIQIK